MISYQTAYLKAHYPLQFFGALITSDMDNTDKVIRYINDAREMGIQILPPDVNESQKDFSISKDALLFGLGAIKNVGSAAIDQIIETREEVGRFDSLKQLCEQVDLRQVNKRVIESLVKSGACDSLEEGRASMMHHLLLYTWTWARPGKETSNWGSRTCSIRLRRKWQMKNVHSMPTR